MILYFLFFLLLGNECCERLAYYGMSSNLMIYFTKQLNQHTAEASRNVSNWSGTCYIMPLLGAFLADSCLGRYWTIASFSIIYFIVCIAFYGWLFFRFNKSRWIKLLVILATCRRCRQAQAGSLPWFICIVSLVSELLVAVKLFQIFYLLIFSGNQAE